MTTLDRIRHITVAVCAVLAIVGSFIGSGAAGGTPIAEAAGGALAADATLVAPGTGAFQIWGIIYVGLLAYAVWQFVPAQATAERHRRLGWWVAASLLLNAAWILSIQFDQLWLSVPVIVVLLVVLGITFRIAYSTVSTNPLDAVFTDGTIGLYLGWVCVATVANVTAWLVDLGFDGLGIAPEAWSAAVVIVAGLVGVLLAVVGNGRLTPAISLSWGLVWIAIARLSGAPQSTPTAVAALVVVAGVLVVTAVFRGRRPSRHPARVPSPR
ncbi:TspO/MBR related protein [Frondihabitans sp. PhB188]|uniref:tryptophan-rich sensory protein n=1 Tax=Frondihabitans sp. PhB188 TaxID=2485200 RepID=UPI000F4817FE|nr:tryptophan-rich sensory protein [Frondihabitans sp. PhB188]ROQ41615.1 TspO/MBR related protein [Frondihabitans sp. PhB188]